MSISPIGGSNELPVPFLTCDTFGGVFTDPFIHVWTVIHMFHTVIYLVYS